MAEGLSDGLRPRAARQRAAEMITARSDVRLLNIVLGDARFWEVFYALFAPDDPALKALFPPLPPKDLRLIVSDWQAEMFLWTGYVDIDTFLRIADQHLPAARRATGPRILDFGAGCGRLARFLDIADAPWTATACDVNPAMVAWCAANLRRVRSFRNGPMPPLDVPPASFDLLLMLSVFTHLDMAGIRAWLAEFSRVLAPGAIAIVTTHGTCALETLAGNPDLQGWFRMSAAQVASVRASVDAGGFSFLPYDADVLASADAGASYGSTFLGRARFEATIAGSGFELVEFRPGGMRGWQDIYVLRRA